MVKATLEEVEDAVRVMREDMFALTQFHQVNDTTYCWTILDSQCMFRSGCIWLVGDELRGPLVDLVWDIL